MALARKWRTVADALPRGEDSKKAAALHNRAYASFYRVDGPRNRRASVRDYQAAAELGYDVAWLNLGCCYEAGHGVRKDRRKGFECYVRSAELGCKAAKREVAECLIHGRGIGRDVRSGVELLNRLARKDPEATCELASRFRYGYGLPKDLAKAERLLRRGAAAGHSACRAELAVLLHDHVKTPRGLSEAIAMCRLAARAGEANACWNLSRSYSSGDGVREDDAAAVRWLQKAVENNVAGPLSCSGAFVELAERYIEGDGVPRNVRRAKKLLRDAALTGSETARRKLRALEARSKN